MRRTAIQAAPLLLSTALLTTVLVPPLPRLVWNLSASAPLGLYLVQRGTRMAKGDMVVARIDGPMRDMAARRRYLPLGVPLIKRIAAEPGDHVCSRHDQLHVNRAPVALQHARDALGRPLNPWRGCRRLSPREVLLLMDAPRSFDGRYFGPLDRERILGRALPLWTW